MNSNKERFMSMPPYMITSAANAQCDRCDTPKVEANPIYEGFTHGLHL